MPIFEWKNTKEQNNPHIKVHEVLVWLSQPCLHPYMRDNILLYDREYSNNINKYNY